MGREIAVSLYLLVFRLFFCIFRIFPQEQKTTFVASFGDNVHFTLQELEQVSEEQVVILKTSQCKFHYEEKDRRTVLLFEPIHIFQWMRSIYHLATSTHIYVDNYFGFLAVAHFRKNVSCVQLWHAAGAVKQFGLMDPSNRSRSPRALERFQKVYDTFTHVVVGSKKMTRIFEESFGMKDDSRILRTGIPRTDFFYDQQAVDIVVNHLHQEFPIIRNKKVILYAPTFRDDELHTKSLALDVGKMHTAFHEDYVLFLRLHPAVQFDFNNQFPGFVYNVSHYPDINHILCVSDILISDYSSIPFEFSLLKRPMIFYAYDLEEYSQSRGFWEPYEAMMPGPVVKTTDEIVEVISEGEFDMGQVVAFAEEWNVYSRGQSSKQLVQSLHTNRETIREKA